MSNLLKSKQVISFIVVLIVLLFARELLKSQLLDNSYNDYNIHSLVGTLFNIILSVVAFMYIKKNDLFELAGLTKIKPQKWWLVLFPLLYLTALNALSMDDFGSTISMTSIVLLIVYCISIGVSEELALRGFLQSFLIKNSKNTKSNRIKAVLIAAFIFGVLHLLKFDKGLYGELSQVVFATFIGVCFGAVLLAIKRLYPLIIAHAIIDFAAKLDVVGQPIKTSVAEPQTPENALLVALLVLPVFLYGLFILKKLK